MTPDADIVAAVKEGDRDRYAELVERHQRMVYGIAWSRLGDADLCEDAAQETFIKAFRYLIALRDPAKFPMWLARIARNVSTSFLRTRKRELERRERWRLESPQAHTPTQVEDTPSVDRTLADTLATLPEQHRECLVLFYLEGRSVHHAAERLGISETAMKTRLHRARAALRDRLEEALESGLSGLGPRTGFTAGLMPLLPSMPIAAGLGGASALGKFLGGFAKLSFPLVATLAPAAFLAAMLGWHARLESRNLAPSPARAIRGRILSHSSVMVVVVILACAGLVTPLQIYYDPSEETLFRIIGLYSLCASCASSRVLRVNRAPFTIGFLLTNGILTLVFLAIGFLHAPFWIYLAAMVPISCFYYHAYKSIPRRQDYNLFLRKAIGLLGARNASGPERSALTRTQLYSFVRFLGARFLAQDYRFIDGGVMILLPPVKKQFGQFVGWYSSNSSVTVSPDGRVTAFIGSKDLRDLRTLVGSAVSAKDSLERGVAEVVEAALQLFVAGQADQAEALLQTENDAQIFRKPAAKSSAYRLYGIVLGVFLVSSVTYAVLLCARHSANLSTPFPGLRTATPESAATPEQIRAALVSWAGKSHPRDPEFAKLTSCEKWPPFTALGNKAQQRAFKVAVMQWLSEGNEGRPLQCIYENFFDPRLLWLAIDSGTLSMDDLAGLGLTTSGLRQYLTDDGNNAIRMMGLPPASGLGASESPHELVDIARVAQQLACLEAFGCLDLVDAQRLAAEIAAKQITPDWVAPKDHVPIEPAAVAGLFDFNLYDLRSTYAALRALQILGKLEMVDREACVNTILRYHEGQGRFPVTASKGGAYFTGNDTDGYFALEALAILGAVDRVKDLDTWQIRPAVGRGVTWWTVQCWAFQLRLEELRSKAIGSPLYTAYGTLSAWRESSSARRFNQARATLSPRAISGASGHGNTARGTL